MHTETMLRLLNTPKFITDRVMSALQRQEKIDELQEWYDSFSPFPMLHELAEADLKQAVESEALLQMPEEEYRAFQRQWNKLTPAEQRRYLCELAGLPDPERDRAFG